MKLLKHIRTKSRVKSNGAHDYSQPILDNSAIFNASFPPNPTVDFPRQLLGNVLCHVCPHALDDSYLSCENSMTEGGCMLCDMRDLGQCALVNKQWCAAAQNLLYNGIRIDAVHYCEREAELSACRKRRSFNGRMGDLRDPAQERLQLLSRTVRENDHLAQHVRSLRTPYMTRETSQADLARTLAVLPNLYYVDLPDGFFMDSSASDTLKQELESRCPNIRRMKYAAGAERSFAGLAQARHWRLLEDLELCQLLTDTTTLLCVLASLPALCAVEISGLPFFDDNALIANFPNDFLPPLTDLKLRDLTSVSANGLIAYLSRCDVSRTLTSLTLCNTGVHPSSLHSVLACCHELRMLHVSENVHGPFPIKSIPLLASLTLQTLRYEISSLGTYPSNTTAASESFYRYLARSVIEGSLPALKKLYALSTGLSGLLLQPSSTEFTSPSPTTRPLPRLVHLRHPLELYTKAFSELEWHVTIVSPELGDNDSAASTISRPMSLYNVPQLNPQWRDKGRESVVVGNGFGGFLTVPAQDGGPSSPGEKLAKKERYAWMG